MRWAHPFYFRQPVYMQTGLFTAHDWYWQLCSWLRWAQTSCSDANTWDAHSKAGRCKGLPRGQSHMGQTSCNHSLLHFPYPAKLTLHVPLGRGGPGTRTIPTTKTPYAQATPLSHRVTERGDECGGRRESCLRRRGGLRNPCKQHPTRHAHSWTNRLAVSHFDRRSLLL